MDKNRECRQPVEDSGSEIENRVTPPWTTYIRIPWWGKVLIKCVLGGLIPVPYEKIRRLITGGWHGSMQDVSYASGVFNKHWQAWSTTRNTGSGRILELGPGGSLLSALFARQQGIQETWLVDVGDFAVKDVEHYRKIVVKLFPSLADESISWSWETMQQRLGISYYTEGYNSLRTLPKKSLDFSFSHAVLEHVRLDQFRPMVRALRQLHKPGSLTSHQIDFRDHLGGGLHHLRFGDRLWESRWFPNDGFYTNRLRLTDVKRIFAEERFELVSETLRTWTNLPLDPGKMALRFQQMDDADLRVNGALVVWRTLP